MYHISSLSRTLLLTVCLGSATSAFSPACQAQSSDEQAFMSLNNVAMSKMMEGMAIQPSGDIDRDFVAMMTPHHQGAIDMAKAELRYGHNEQLRRIAQQIVVEQQQQIAAMRLAIGGPLPAPAASASPDSRPASPLGSVLQSGWQLPGYVYRINVIVNKF